MSELTGSLRKRDLRSEWNHSLAQVTSQAVPPWLRTARRSGLVVAGASGLVLLGMVGVQMAFVPELVDLCVIFAGAMVWVLAAYRIDKLAEDAQNRWWSGWSDRVLREHPIKYS